MIRKEKQELPVWRMGATLDGPGRRGFLVLKNEFVDYISAVHATVGRNPARLTGSPKVNKVFGHQTPSTAGTRFLWGGSHSFVAW